MNIGHRIKTVCDERGMSYAELARRINKSPQSLNSLFKRQHIDSVDLDKIGKALNHNFFDELSRTYETEVERPQLKVEEADDLSDITVSIKLDGTQETLDKWIRKLRTLNDIISKK